MPESSNFRRPFLTALKRYGHPIDDLFGDDQSGLVTIARERGIPERHISGALAYIKYPVALDCTPQDGLYVGTYNGQYVWAADDPFLPGVEDVSAGLAAFRQLEPPELPPSLPAVKEAQRQPDIRPTTVMHALYKLGFGNIQPAELDTPGYQKTLLDENRISAEQLARAYAELTGKPYIDPRRNPPSPEVRNLISTSTVTKMTLVPHSKQGDTLLILVADPTDEFGFTAIEDELQELNYEIAISSKPDIEHLILTLYTRNEQDQRLLEEAADRRKQRFSLDDEDLNDQSSPVVQRIQTALEEAAANGASDLHFQSEAEGLNVRERLHGNLIPRSVIPPELAPQTINRLKMMARMQIEKREPQDARINVPIRVKGRVETLRLRVSSLGSAHGDSVVMRLLRDVSTLPALEQSSFSSENLELVQHALNASFGIVLVTGPTGSGKTTLMHTVLRDLNTPDVKIMTSEEPIEYEQPGLVQTEITPSITFAQILRAQLRQDPDILFVGEIRDEETAGVAVQAAQTGHLLLSTLHTNDAISTVTRLRNLGIPPYLLADSLRLVISQRLVGSPCPECSVEEPIPAEYVLDNAHTTMRRGTGLQAGLPCPLCHGTGDYGRIAIHEVMPVNDEIRSAIRADNFELLRASAGVAGMRSLQYDGLLKVAQGKANLTKVLEATS